jgi:hypothetical protein
MKKIFITVALLIAASLSTYVSAESFFDGTTDMHIKFGGWSKHGETDKYRKYKHNESHKGMGIQIWKGVTDSRWHLGAEYFNMKDSLNYDATMISLLTKYQWDFNNSILTSFDLSTGITYHDRGFLLPIYTKKDGKIVSFRQHLYRDQITAPSLMLTFRWFDSVETDITYIPSTGFNKTPVVFLRLGIAL